MPNHLFFEILRIPNSCLDFIKFLIDILSTSSDPCFMLFSRVHVLNCELRPVDVKSSFQLSFLFPSSVQAQGVLPHSPSAWGTSHWCCNGLQHLSAGVRLSVKALSPELFVILIMCNFLESIFSITWLIWVTLSLHPLAGAFHLLPSCFLLFLCTPVVPGYFCYLKCKILQKKITEIQQANTPHLAKASLSANVVSSTRW